MTDAEETTEDDTSDEDAEDEEDEEEEEEEEENTRTKLEVPFEITGMFLVVSTLHLIQLLLAAYDNRCVCSCL